MIAPNATTTDALATGVSVLGALRGLALIDALPHTAALILTKEDAETRSFASRRFSAITTRGVP